MKEDFRVIPNLLPANYFKQVAEDSRKWFFKPYLLEGHLNVMVSHIPEVLSSVIDKRLSEVLGLKVSAIQTFARLNSEKYDSEFRVHSDNQTMGIFPDIAMVLYMESKEDFGTGLFKHPVHGNCSPKNEAYIHTQDDGKWELYKFQPAVANTAFVYKANMYHCRYPFMSYGRTQKDGRIVIVKFLEILK